MQTNTIENLSVTFTVNKKIAKPVSEVFNAIADKDQLCTYFTSESSASIAKGQTITWKWNGFETCTIAVTEVIPNELIVFSWEGYKVNYDTTTSIRLKEIPEGTLVSIHEEGWHSDQAGLNSSYMNCQGWQNFLDCLKARLIHNIDLRS